MGRVGGRQRGEDVHPEGKQGTMQPFEAAAHAIAFGLDMADDKVLEDGHSRDDDGIETDEGADIAKGIADAEAATGTHYVEVGNHRC